MDESSLLIIGANGQVGTALRQQYPRAKAVDSSQLDITDAEAVKNFDWSGISTILNAAAYTNVPEAESLDGRVAAWKTNATAVGYLAKAATEHDLTLVHISTSYVFNGVAELHSEDEPLSPLSSYGASKAAGDVAVAETEKFYLIRTSAVIGSGKNFVRSIYGLGPRDISPKVVADETDRPTFASEIARGIDFLLQQKAAYGIYNITNSGDVVTWADIARAVYKEGGFDHLTVSDSTAAEYFAGQPIADKRPKHGALDLSKMEKLGFTPRDWREDLSEYVKKELAQ